MTFRELADIINKMSESQKGYNALVYNVDSQKCNDIISLRPIPGEEVYGYIQPRDDNPVFCFSEDYSFHVEDWALSNENFEAEF